MKLRYTLDNEIEGQEVTNYSPKGWEDTELVLKRHEKYDGIFKDYTVKVEFFCGSGKEYIDNVYDTQGIEAVVTVMIEIDCDDSDAYVTLYNGKIIMKTYEKVEAAPEYTRVNLEQNGIIQTVLNRLETKVSLSSEETIDGTPVTELEKLNYPMTLHGKAIEIVGKVSMEEEVSYTLETLSCTLTDENLYFIFPLDTIEYDEFDGLALPLASGLTIATPNACDIPILGFTPVFQNTTGDSIDLSLDYDFRGSIIEDNDDDRDYSAHFYYKLGVGGFGAISPTTISTIGIYSLIGGETNTIDIDFQGTLNLTIPNGYEVYIYIQFTNYDISGIASFDVHHTVCSVGVSQTSVEPDTVGNVSAVFETVADIARKITNQSDAFRSNFFGRKDSQPFPYSENGCGSFSAITNGFQIRGFPLVGSSGRPITISMKEYFEGLNAIHCLGLGVKEEGDNTYIEVEPKEYFYRNETILTFSNVKSLKTRIEEKLFYNRARVGYEKWRKEGSNGLDEFCTTYNYNLLLKSVSNDLDAVSTLIAAPYAIERQRRSQYSTTPTNDEEYDEENFIIALNRDVDYLGVPANLTIAEKDENFTDVEKVFSSSTIYNLRLKPARNFKNWLKILGTSVIKSNATLKNIKFSSAEGNYRITSKGIETCDPANQTLLTSNEDVELMLPNTYDNYEPLFTGETDEFEIPMSLADYLTLKEVDINDVPNFYKKIQYSTTDQDYLTGYISEIRYRPIKGVARCKTLRAYEAGDGCSYVYVEEGYVECGYVE